MQKSGKSHKLQELREGRGAERRESRNGYELGIKAPRQIHGTNIGFCYPFTNWQCCLRNTYMHFVLQIEVPRPNFS